MLNYNRNPKGNDLHQSWKEAEKILLTLPSLHEIKITEDIQEQFSPELKNHLEVRKKHYS